MTPEKLLQLTQHPAFPEFLDLLQAKSATLMGTMVFTDKMEDIRKLQGQVVAYNDLIQFFTNELPTVVNLRKVDAANNAEDTPKV